MRDVRRYIKQFNQCNLEPVDFFKESTDRDRKGETRPCYRITKKGCEFIAHKLTGTKGTIFTARYINRFHEMQDILSGQQESELPWFIKKFRGNYIVLWRDFSTITGVDIERCKPKAWYPVVKGGRDFNGCGWKYDNEKFKREYGFEYGDEPCLKYFYLCGVPKVLHLLENDTKVKLLAGCREVLMDGIKSISKGKQEIQCKGLKEVVSEHKTEVLPIQISITLNGNEVCRQL